MDSISQAALGGAVGLLAVGGRHPKRAIVYGALLATLPDLDILVRHESDLMNTIKHRTWSHSWPVLALLAPLFAWGLHRFDKSYDFGVWWWFCFLVLTTHAALDAMTVYGTDIFWPFAASNVMRGSVFIIDPLFTLPLVVGLVFAWRGARRGAGVGLALSCAYLAWGAGAQAFIAERAAETLARENIAYERLLVTPTPFNSVLWRIVAVGAREYHEGFYGFLDSPKRIEFHSFARNSELRARLPARDLWERANRFNHGFNSMEILHGQIILTDLRMGIEPFYFFRFALAQLNAAGDAARLNGVHVRKHLQSHAPPKPFFGWLWRRMFDAEVGAYHRE